MHMSCCYSFVFYTDWDWLHDFGRYCLVFSHLRACGSMKQIMQMYCVRAKGGLFFMSIQCGKSTPTFWFIALHLPVSMNVKCQTRF